MPNSVQVGVLLGLRERIPGMFCIPGCTACCSHVPWSKTEWALLPEHFKQTHTIHSIKCPFVKDGQCSCHDHRPLTCRLFGVSEGLPCPMGVPVENPLSGREAADIYKTYSKLFKET